MSGSGLMATDRWLDQAHRAPGLSTRRRSIARLLARWRRIPERAGLCWSTAMAMQKRRPSGPWGTKNTFEPRRLTR